ncbi:DgyrCDS5727 [Dimorphilus gyrociliatus]|uniref:DgyrCDS5727 n=1 Tax=Dimorphilus gyrociliatus TaxID=2664684 RepID=A0A7I8VQK9_9ANNE|nr:DgyrCDS5727 [Dimorphilus gyrociliatus]
MTNNNIVSDAKPYEQLIELGKIDNNLPSPLIPVETTDAQKSSKHAATDLLSELKPTEDVRNGNLGHLGNKRIVEHFRTDSRSSGASLDSKKGRVRNKAEALSKNLFLSDYDMEKELKTKTELLLTKVRIDAKSTAISQPDLLFMIKNAESEGYFYEYSKLYQFVQMKEIRNNINEALIEAQRLMEGISEEEMFIQNLSNEEDAVEKKLSQSSACFNIESKDNLETSAKGNRLIKVLKENNCFEILTDKERWMKTVCIIDELL